MQPRFSAGSWFFRLKRWRKVKWVVSVYSQGSKWLDVNCLRYGFETRINVSPLILLNRNIINRDKARRHIIYIE